MVRPNLGLFVSRLRVLAARKWASTNTRTADDRLPSTRLLAMELMSAAVVIPRSRAISRSACQNGSSRLTLVLCPDSTTDRFRTGLGISCALRCFSSVMIARAPNSP